MTWKKNQTNNVRVDVRVRVGGGGGGGLSSPLLYSPEPSAELQVGLSFFLFLFFFSFFEADEPSSHTMESLISEPSLTRGRGLVGEYSTWLSLALSGRRSDASEKLLLLSGDDSWVGVLQM